MGTVYAEITLKNMFDVGKAREGLMKEHNIRTATVTAIVDTGAMTLVITEELFQELGLSIIGEKMVRTASGQRCKVTEPVGIHWKDRFSALSAVVIPGAEVVLLGVLPLEDMDLIVNPGTQELQGAHGDIVECMVLSWWT
jgi:clan AA aspartic protease